MKINKVIIIGLILLATSCSSILKNNEGIFGNASKQEAKVDSQIRLTENAQAQLNEDTLKHIGAIAQGGVEHSLNQIVTNISQEVIVAKEMNQRVEALAGKPDFNEVKEIENIVDKLLSQVDKVRNEGSNALNNKDKEIQTIQNTAKELDKQREDQIASAMATADKNALKADQYKATLSQMDKFGGLGAIFYGVKRLIVRLAWFLGIGSVLFFILRLLSFSNPVCAEIFSIFSKFGSWVIYVIEYIVPKSVNEAELVTSQAYNALKIEYESLKTSVIAQAVTPIAPTTTPISGSKG